MKRILAGLLVFGLCAPVCAETGALAQLKKVADELQACVPESRADPSAGGPRKISGKHGPLAAAAGGDCKLVEQSGTLDSWACRSAAGKIRCYADVKVKGVALRVWGGCWSSYSDCWSIGPGAVNPCE